MQTRLILTSDDSHTLYVPELDETYHSQNGAVAESSHVYIEAGFKHIAKQKECVKLFEFGFGTGLNALLSWIEADKMGKTIVYDTVEKYPLPAAIYTHLNYDKQTTGLAKLLPLHEAKWGSKAILSSHFTLCKYNCDIWDFPFPNSFYDLVYYDAFGPSKQSESWQMPLLEKIAHSVSPGGIIVTYCSQGQFRRDLKSLGFHIEKLEGPKGKREITRAIKQ